MVTKCTNENLLISLYSYNRGDLDSRWTGVTIGPSGNGCKEKRGRCVKKSLSLFKNGLGTSVVITHVFIFQKNDHGTNLRQREQLQAHLMTGTHLRTKPCQKAPSRYITLICALPPGFPPLLTAHLFSVHSCFFSSALQHIPPSSNCSFCFFLNPVRSHMNSTKHHHISKGRE